MIEKHLHYLDDLLAIGGVALIGYGVYQVLPPIAFIVVGALLIAYAFKSAAMKYVDKQNH